MIKRAILGAVALAVASVVATSQVVDPMNVMGDDVVGLRKNAMRAINSEFAAIRAASSAGDLEAAKSSALSLAVLAGVLPLLFEEAYADAYPYEGSQFRFEAGDSAVLLRHAGSLQTAAMAAANASSMGDVDVRAIGGSCAACHTAFRRR